MPIEKLQVVGFEATRGVSKKTGKPYEVGQLHVIHKLAPPLGDSVAVGYMGSSYSVDIGIIEKLGNVSCPFWADVNIESVMRYGQRQSVVLSAVPIKT